ncbi:uncharacterized protein LOC114515803 isoform X2 [Dendronephthya gigantea]|uniref:uncharacterized protein LOC114515803 isoform X2 n=1 Tax=Dendronephthya gigantea TaxID=151771 RepID=UPI001069B92C|nr:uncharacterized protein LOC114515803 isoform X2 [Dendronephthya gigantea]
MEITVYKAALFTCFLAVITAVSANTNYAGSCVTPIDVAFLMDSSGSLGTTNYKRLKDTVGIMGKYFGVSPMGSHAAIILYSDNSLISARLDQFSTQAQFQTKVNRLRYLSQRSRMDASLTAAHSRIFTQAGNARDYLPKVAILFTDGQQTRFRDRVPLPDAAKRLRERGVEIFVIGVGNGPSTNEMESMVVDKKNHVMRIRSFRILKEQSESIAERVCQLFGARKQDVSPYPMDIGFMIHIPPSYRRREQNKAKQFIASVATTLGVELPNSRAAFLQYNETVGPVITFSEFSGLKKFYDDLSYLSKNGEMSKIAVAISEASKRIFSTDSRLAVSRVAVLLKFGQADDIQEAEVAAAQLRLKGVKLFVVHVGDAREMDSIRNLVSDAENLFHANDVAGLANVVIPIHNKIISESVPTAKELSSLPVSYSSIQVKWIPAFDPKNVISGYELTWKVVEDDKGRNVINSPLRSSGVLPVDASKYDIKNLTPYTLYKIYLQPQWAPGVRGDIPETQSRTLEDIDECLNDPCDDNAKCTNTKRSFTCECNTGYTGDGFTCRDIDECEGSPCDANGECYNNPGSFKCSCNTGYTGNGFTCSDVDECEVSPCSADGKCSNNPGSFECDCNIGYAGNGFTCSDIDECEGSPCDANGKCSNNPGSFECSCNTGYAGNGFTCSDIDECQGSPCDVNGKCSNNAGSFECECKIGYYGNGFTCDDINECLRNPCDINAACSNNDGSYSCACKTGYSGDGFFCADNNECNNRPCNENAKCQNSAGSFSCSCNIGYLGDGFTCEDVNECNNEVPPCDENAKCFNNEGSYYCECNAGYNGNGKICAAVNICSYPMDLAIAIDTSDSITHSDFEIQKSAVIMLARSFGLSDSKTHVAVIVYGSESRVAINLSDHVDLESFANAVRSIKYEGGQTRIDLALAIASNSVFTPSGGARVGMPKMLIIMTDGQQTSAPDAIELSDAVAPLASIGIHIVSIGIGHEVDEYELMAISESRKNIYHVKTFDTLFDTVTVVGQSLCQKAQKDCKRHADIVLLVDSSASMRGGNYLKQKTLLKAIGREFDVSMYGSHVGIVLYNSEAEVITGFNNKTTLKSFENIVDNLPLKGGKIRLDKALRLAASDVLTKEKGMRSENIPKILFILTDGTQNKKCDEEALELAIAPLRNEGVHVIAIGVGEAEKNELRPLVKTQRDLFIGDDFEEVTEPVLDLIKVLCKETEQLCNLGSQYVDINVDGCINEYPVEVVVCDGKCSSGTRYINEAPFYEGRCSCCFPSVLNSKDVILKCPNDTTKRHRITVPAACACRSCGNTAAAPPIENKENEAKIDTPGI